jgi:hypothetical protein
MPESAALPVDYLARVIEGAERVQRTICAYGGSVPCDCKYGASFKGEQTGCPELRDAIGLLRNIGRVLSGEPVMTATQWHDFNAVMERVVGDAN